MKIMNQYPSRLVQIKLYGVIDGVLRTRKISSYLQTHAVHKLQIGSGPNVLPGWLNTDVFPEIGLVEGFAKILHLDATKPFPFGDGTMDYIFSEHVIEHLSYNQAVAMLSECFRILRPGGWIRIATPDLQAIAGTLGHRSSEAQRSYARFISSNFLSEIDAEVASADVIEKSSLPINILFYGHGHRFVYDEATLQATMQHVGFGHVRRERPGESADPALRDLERHGSVIRNEDANRFETMVLEATRTE